MVDVGMINDVANLIKLKRAQPFTFLGITHFEGHSILNEPIERLDVSMDVDISS